jgi:hypothetical protein
MGNKLKDLDLKKIGLTGVISMIIAAAYQIYKD